LVSGKIFNLHPSLLPQYRGCSSTSWALINGENIIGYTYHYIDSQIDTGKIILQKVVVIEEFDTGLSLYYKMMYEALNDFKKAFDLVNQGYEGENQNGTGTYFSRGAPNNCIIDRNWPISKIEKFIRALNYPPLPPALLDGKEVRTIDDYLKLI
jgi:methionyl-tRNA formyltransferase